MESYKNKRILVTGGTGFIGSRLAERLVLEKGAIVRVLVHNWTKATWVSRSNVELIQGDISIYEDIEKALEGIDIVFHCVGVGGSIEQCMKINFKGTKNILDACLKAGVKRIVYLSSAVVHGPETYESMDEKAKFINAGNPYADSKIETEKHFLDFISKNNVEGVVIRPTFIWGPVSLYYEVDRINQMKSGNFLLVDKGEGSCNAVHVDNVVDLCLLCGLHEKANGEIFFSTDSKKLKWKEFWGYYAKMIGKDIHIFKSVPSVETTTRKISIGLKKMLLQIREQLTSIIDKNEIKHPLLVRYILKAPRKGIKILIRKVSGITTEMDPWNLKTYSSKGF